jgi:hypothetical protein
MFKFLCFLLLIVHCAHATSQAQIHLRGVVEPENVGHAEKIPVTPENMHRFTPEVQRVLCNDYPDLVKCKDHPIARKPLKTE